MDSKERPAVQVLLLLRHGEQHGFLPAATEVLCDDGRALAAEDWHPLGVSGLVTLGGDVVRVRPYPDSGKTPTS